MQNKQSPTPQKISCCSAIWGEQYEIINPKIHWSSTNSFNRIPTPSSVHHSKISLKIPPLPHHQLPFKEHKNLGLISVNTLNQKEKQFSKEMTQDIQHQSSSHQFSSIKYQQISQMKGMEDTKEMRDSVKSLKNISQKQIPEKRIISSEREPNKSKLCAPSSFRKNKLSISNLLTAQTTQNKTNTLSQIYENRKDHLALIRKQSNSEIMETSGNSSKSLKLGRLVWTVISEVEEDKEEPRLKIEESEIFLNFFNQEDSQLSRLQRR